MKDLSSALCTVYFVLCTLCFGLWALYFGLWPLDFELWHSHSHRGFSPVFRIAIKIREPAITGLKPR